jgi:hypothetical protein
VLLGFKLKLKIMFMKGKCMKKAQPLLSISDVELSQMIVEYLMNGNPHYQLGIESIADRARCWPKRIKEIIVGKSSFKLSHLKNLVCSIPGNVHLLMCRCLCKKIDLYERLTKIY